MLYLKEKSLLEIIDILTSEIEKSKVGDICKFVTINDNLKTWLDLAEILHCKLLIPTKIDDEIIISFQKLDSLNSFHLNKSDVESKYGINSIFSTINKENELSFLYHYKQALKNVNIKDSYRILNLGINNGDEFKIIQQLYDNFDSLELVGVDYCQSAIEEAKITFVDNTNVKFYNKDINKLKELNLEKFDLIISIGTLQSSSLNFKPFFQSIVQEYLKKNGAMIIGFPNCRWIDGTMIYGAKAPNYNYPEMSILYNDVMFSKKYLQQKKFRVTITGKEYIFLTATSIR